MIKPELINETFSDIEQIREVARHWDLDFRQTQAGALAASMVQQLRPDYQLAYAEFSRCVRQEGLPPLTGRTFAVQSAPRPLIWCGQEVGFNDLLVFHPTAGFSSLSAPGFSVFTITIAESEWQHIRQSRLNWAARDDFRDECVLRVPASKLQELRYLLAMQQRLIISQHTGIDAGQEIIATLIAVLANSKTAARDAMTAGARAVRLASEHVYNAGRRPIPIAELCQLAAVSERTLQYAFQKHTGQAPIAFIRSFRLSQVRRELLANNANEPISTIAKRWGFSHMGQFARYYRTQFGGLPSAAYSD